MIVHISNKKNGTANDDNEDRTLKEGNIQKEDEEAMWNQKNKGKWKVLEKYNIKISSEYDTIIRSAIRKKCLQKTACGLAKEHCLFQVWNTVMQRVFSGLKTPKLVNPSRTYCWPLIQSLLSQCKDWESRIHLTTLWYPHLVGHMRLSLYATGRNGPCGSDDSRTKADD